MATGKTLAAIGDDGTPVDWWFAYKTPKKALAAAQGGAASTGFEYLYADARDTTPRLSARMIDGKAGAWIDTLAQILPESEATPATTGWVMYNDEAFGRKSGNDSSKGHCKGILAYDTATNTAFWLLHSTPCAPAANDPSYPEGEVDYGQTFLCITLKDVATARTIAAMMCRQQEPETYHPRNAAGLAADDPLVLVNGTIDVNATDAPVDVTISSKRGAPFRVFAKNRHWGKDLWTDLVGPGLGVDLAIETWRRGQLPSTDDSDGKDDVEDILDIDFSQVGATWWWPYTKDHAKWAASEDPKRPWVVIADINRQTSQSKRGGGAICFLQPQIWRTLVAVETAHPAGAELEALPDAVQTTVKPDTDGCAELEKTVRGAGTNGNGTGAAAKPKAGTAAKPAAATRAGAPAKTATVKPSAAAKSGASTKKTSTRQPATKKSAAKPVAKKSAGKSGTAKTKAKKK